MYDLHFARLKRAEGHPKKMSRIPAHVSFFGPQHTLLIWWPFFLLSVVAKHGVTCIVARPKRSEGHPKKLEADSDPRPSWAPVHAPDFVGFFLC
jgi:hypothetical protein